MQRTLVPTADGSLTVKDPRTGEHYHSLHGAESESKHVFIQAGLHSALASFSGELLVLEVGFGTGLNALLSWQEAVAQQRHIRYLAIEPYPLPDLLLRSFHAPALQRPDSVRWNRAFLSLHGLVPDAELPGFQGLSTGSMDRRVLSAGVDDGRSELPGFFSCLVLPEPIQTAALPDQIQLVYYDAFSPDREPDLWTNDIWQKLFVRLAPGGILVTYCAKGSVRRALGDAGFLVERLAGPAYKRHMLRAVKPRHNLS